MSRDPDAVGDLADEPVEPLAEPVEPLAEPFDDSFVDPDVEPRDVRDPALHPGVLAAIGVGGAVGSLARWGVGRAVPHDPGAFPASTLLVNLVGSYLLGALLVVVAEVRPSSRLLRPFVGVGVLGGFTTFSTAMLDVHALVQAGRTPEAAGYLAVSVLAGLGAVLLGAGTARLVVPTGARAAS